MIRGIRELWRQRRTVQDTDLEVNNTDIQPYTLSADYHAHKRTTLIASAALLAISLPSVSTGEFTLWSIKLSISDRSFVQFSVFVVALYYFLNYAVIWLDEGLSFVRYKGKTFPEVERNINSALNSCNDAIQTAKEAIVNLRAVQSSRFADTVASAGGALDLSGLIKTIVTAYAPWQRRSLEHFATQIAGPLNLGSSNEAAPSPIWEDLHLFISAQADELDLGLQQALLESDLAPFVVQGPSQLASLKEASALLVSVTKGQLARSNKTLSATRRNALAIKIPILVRIFWIDLAFPAALLCVAIAHYIGKVWWSYWRPLSDVLHPYIS